jgi:hypothetical protein
MAKKNRFGFVEARRSSQGKYPTKTVSDLGET